MWIKKLPGIVANAAVLILNVFAILMIVGLFLHQGTTGERVKETITRFSSSQIFATCASVASAFKIVWSNNLVFSIIFSFLL